MKMKIIKLCRMCNVEFRVWRGKKPVVMNPEYDDESVKLKCYLIHPERR